MSRYEIPVTAEHITAGLGFRGDGCRCPVTRATTEVVPGVGYVDASGAYGPEGRGKKIGTWANEYDVGSFIALFDTGHEVKPFTAILDTEYPR